MPSCRARPPACLPACCRVDCPALRVPADLFVKYDSLVFGALDALKPTQALMDALHRCCLPPGRPRRPSEAPLPSCCPPAACSATQAHAHVTCKACQAVVVAWICHGVQTGWICHPVCLTTLCSCAAQD